MNYELLKANYKLLKAGIFNLSPKRFNALAEEIVSHVFPDKTQNDTIKFSRAILRKKKTYSSFLDECLDESQNKKAVSSKNINNSNLDCNIQQIKCNEFNVLYYGVFFDDCIEIYKTTSKDIPSIPGYCNIQHKGNWGEGQFHITTATIDWHRQNNLCKVLSYQELFLIIGGANDKTM